MADRRNLTTLGLILIGIGVVAGILSAVLPFPLLGGLSGGTLVFIGIVLLVVGYWRGGGGQQQQQQVVIVTGGGGPASAGAAPAQAMVKCPKCARLNGFEAAFCGECGTKIGR